MKTMIWKYEDKRTPFLEFPEKIPRDDKSKWHTCTEIELSPAACWRIARGTTKDARTKHFTPNEIYDYLEKGIRYRGPGYEEYKEILDKSVEAGIIPEISIGTPLATNNILYNKYGIVWKEALPWFVHVREKHNYPDDDGVCKLAKQMMIE